MTYEEWYRKWRRMMDQQAEEGQDYMTFCAGDLKAQMEIQILEDMWELGSGEAYK